MPRFANQKLKCLYLVDFLLQNSDEQHAVTVAQMAEYLAQRGISAERKSLYSDLEALRQWGLDVEYRKSPDSGYYIATTEEERRRGLANLRHQIKEISAGIEGVEGADLDRWQRLTGFNEQLEKIMKRK